MNYLELISNFFIIIGNFFIIASMCGIRRYSNFFIKLHTLNMFGIYGMTFIFLSVGILTYEPIIFFEICGIIILNILSVLSINHCLFRNAALNGIECIAKNREEVLKMKENEKKEFYESIKKKNKKKEEKNKLKEELEKKKIREKLEKEKIKREENERIKKEKEKLKMEKKLSKEKEKEEKKKKTESVGVEDTKKAVKSVVDAPKDSVKPTNTVADVAEKMKKENEMAAKAKKEANPNATKENDELKAKIKEQKKILRKKLESIRRDAFITRKPEEIEKAEKLISDILTKHNLTEEMLKDDDEK